MLACLFDVIYPERQTFAMSNIYDGNTSHSLSAVVAFRGRELIQPRGIDGGEMLAWASADELLAHHLELASEPRAFWKDCFLLNALWENGDFCGLIPHQVVRLPIPILGLAFTGSSMITARRSARRRPTGASRY